MREPATPTGAPATPRSIPTAAAPCRRVAQLAACMALACQDPEFVLRVPSDAALTVTTPPDGAVQEFFDMGVAPDSCGRFAPSPRFKLCSATYAGGAGEDRAEAIAIAADGSLLVAGNFSSAPFRLPVREIEPAGDGAILQLSGRGTEALGFVRVPGRARHIAVQRGGAGRVALATDRGALVLDARSWELSWTVALDGGVARIAIGSEGTVAALDGARVVHLFNAAGSPLAAFGLDEEIVSDLAVDDARDSIYVVGARRTSEGCNDLLPFLRAYDFGARVRFRAYEDGAPGDACAPSQGVRVALGRDGLLYYAGHNEGGNSVHLRDPAALSAPAAVLSYDAFTSPAGPASRSFGFVARFDPDSGALLAGQMLLPRDGETGGRLTIQGLGADADGHVYLAGEASCCLAEREDLTLNGIAPGPYDSGDLFVAVLERSFTRRLAWVTWTGRDGVSATASGIAVGERVVAVAANQRGSSSAMITHAPIQARPADPTDAFVSVFPAVPFAP